MSELLIATADAAVALFLQKQFEHDHIIPHCVDTVSASLRLMDNNPVKFSTAVIDADLPDGDAFALCSRLRMQHPVAVLMIVTDEQVDPALNCGADEVITRPLNLTMLRWRVRRLIDDQALRAQAEHDQWYRNIVENDLAGVFRSSIDGHYLFANIGLVQMLGYDTVSELMALNIPQDVFMNPQDRLDLIADAPDTTDLIRDNLLLKRKDGTAISVTINSRTIFDANGNIEYFEGFVIDNSQRARAEAAERKAREFAETLREVTATLTSSLDIDDVLEKITMGVERLLPRSTVSIMLIEGDDARMVRQRGMEQHVSVEDLFKRRYPISEIPIFRKLIETRKGHLVQDTRSNSDWRVLLETDWIKSHIALPIATRDRVIGILNIDSATPNTFGESDVGRMQTFADQAAIAIENARTVQLLRSEIIERVRAQSAEHRERLLAEALRDTAAALTSTLEIDEVFARILTNISRVLPHDGASIILEKNGKPVIVQHRGLVEHSPFLSMTVMNEKIVEVPRLRGLFSINTPFVAPNTAEDPMWVVFPGTEWIQSHIGAPIIVRGRTIGLVNVDSATPYAFSPGDASRIQAFADQAAIAIENARTVEQLRAEIEERQRAEKSEREQRELAEALRDASAIINSALDLDEVLDRILLMIHRVLPVDVANILLIENDCASSVRTIGYERHDLQKQMNGLEMNVHEVPNLRRMMSTRQPIVIPNTADQPDWIIFEQTSWVNSCVNAPILVDGSVIGFLNLDSSAPFTFNTSHGERLQAFANQVGIAIHHARLYEASQQYNRELEDRVAARTIELERHRAQLKAILDNINEGVNGVIFEPGSTRIAERHINAALHTMFGYTAEEWDVARLRPDTVSVEEFERILTIARTESYEKGIYHITTPVRRRDGSVFDAAITVSRINNSDNHIIGSVTVYRDVSQARALEARQARFVAAAAHELRSPLSSFKTRLHLTRRKPQALDHNLDILDEVANQMERLVNDLLNQARFEHGLIELRPTRLELQPFLQHILDLQQPEAEQKHIALAADMLAEPVYIMADTDRLHQVVTNLIINAITYTPENGQVTLHLKQAGSGQVLIQVEDTGAGIAPEHLPNIFEPFYRARKVGQGMGLGLSIAREIVELHGGKISVESEMGRGTRFNVLLSLETGSESPV